MCETIEPLTERVRVAAQDIQSSIRSVFHKSVSLEHSHCSLAFGINNFSILTSKYLMLPPGGHEGELVPKI